MRRLVAHLVAAACCAALSLPSAAYGAEGSGAVAWEKGAFSSAAAKVATNGPPPAAPAVAPALPEGSGVVLDTSRVTVRVRVERLDAAFKPVAAVGQKVQVDVIAPPHQVMTTREAVTDGSGDAVVELPVMPGLQAFVRVDGSSDVFAKAGLPLESAGVQQTTIRLLEETGDKSAVFASRVVTVLEAWEDFVAVSQVWTLSVDRPVRYVSPPLDRANPATGAIVIPLPEGASGIEVVMPREGATVLDDSVFLHMNVEPSLGDLARKPTLILRYSLKTNGAPTATIRQQLSMDVEAISVVAPRTTNFEKHPSLDIVFDAPMCSAGEVPGKVCFAELTDKADGAMLREGTEVRVIRGGRGRTGDLLEVTTTGWPGHRPWEAWLAGAVLLLAVGASLLLLRADRRKAVDRRSADRSQVLEQERAALLARAAEVATALVEGELLEADYEQEIAGIEARLAVVVRRLRELAEPPEQVAG